MFENSNKGIVKEIADETMRVHRLRNIMACFAIALTAILITIICGAGISTVRALRTEHNMNPGPGSFGAGIGGGLSVLEEARKQPGVEWADIARPCSKGTPRNMEFAGNTVKLLGVSDSYYEHNYVDLMCGEYPKNARQIIVSDTMAEKAQMKLEPGQKMTLNLVAANEDETTEKPTEVTVTGFYKNPLRAIENYEEIYTTQDFPDIYNLGLEDENSVIYTKLSGVTASTPNAEVEQLLTELNEKAGGTGIYYILNSGIGAAVYLGAAAILLLIIACGYFLIYNIFYISIVNDIRFMGDMKTIGMTGRQVRTMLGYQVRRLGCVGTVLGVLTGSFMNLYVIQMFQNLEYTFSAFYEAKTSLVIAVPAAVAFSAATVWISSRKALKLASKVSPVEASRFRTSGKKKTVFAVISFALSGILFCVLYTAMTGYDVEYMVNRMNGTDFNVYQYHAGQLMEEPYEPMDEAFANELKSLDFAKEGYTYYRARNLKEKADDGIYPESYGNVKYEGRFKEVMEKETEDEGTESYQILPDGNYEIGILGMEAKALPIEKEQIHIFSGEIDEEKFATGDYLIYQPANGWGKDENYQFDALKAGEQLEISFYNFETSDYVTKTFTVMAVVGSKKTYGGELSSAIQLVINDTAFREIYGESAERMVSGVHLNTSGGNAKEQQKLLDKMTAETFNTQIRVSSKYKTRLMQQEQKMQKTILGIFVGLVFGFIGMANVVNTLVTGVLSRKIEFAAMQSIGMTSRQMTKTIFKDGMKMVLISFAILIPLGIPIGISVAGEPLSTGFVPLIYAKSVCMVVAAGMILTALVSVILTKVLNKKTVVERLREAD